MNSYIQSFKEYLELELNYSLKTIKTYDEALKRYQDFLTIHHLSFLSVTKDIATSYKAYLVKENYEAKTSSLYLSAVRSFYHYLVEIKKININPFAHLKNPKVSKKLPSFLNASEEEKFFLEENTDDDLKVRNYFIILFLYTTGLRVSELCQIKLEDMHFNEKKVKVMGKGSKERIVFYKAMPEHILKYYIEKVRLRILKDIKSDYLIVSKTGKLSSRSVEKIVHEYALSKHIKSKVTPHTLRHTFATDLLNEGADIRSVGQMLGHESLSTTQIYTHVSAEALKEVYKHTHPRE